MKPYGHSRKDKQECKYGCCTGKSGKHKNCRKIIDRANRKTARQEQQKECHEQEVVEHAQFQELLT